jgi:hypothetical protein
MRNQEVELRCISAILERSFLRLMCLAVDSFLALKNFSYQSAPCESEEGLNRFT